MDQPTFETEFAIAAYKAHRRRLSRRLLWGLDHWVLVFILLFGGFVSMPFLAPIFMHIGWTGPASVIYAIYSVQCHQMAQRSFFLFGMQPMYSESQLPVPITNDRVANMLAYRTFIGNVDLGWKVAWSDRMVYIYGSIWLSGFAFGVMRHRRRVRFPWIVILLRPPMIIDGATHWLSDLSGGVTGGFRYDNRWLANLTGNILPNWFYVGDVLGSVNSWARLLSGLSFGVGIAWLAFPELHRLLQESAMHQREIIKNH